VIHVSIAGRRETQESQPCGLRRSATNGGNFVMCFIAEERKISGLTFDAILGAECRPNADATKRKNRSRAACGGPLQTAAISSCVL